MCKAAQNTIYFENKNIILHMYASERNSKTHTDGLCNLETQRVIAYFLYGIIKKQSNTTIFFSVKEYLKLLMRGMLQKLIIFRCQQSIGWSSVIY